MGVTPVINPEYLGDPTDEPDTARADLFKEGLMVISPVADCPPEAVRLMARHQLGRQLSDEQTAAIVIRKTIASFQPANTITAIGSHESGLIMRRS